MFRFVILSVLVFASVCLSSPGALNYPLGTQYAYNLNSSVNAAPSMNTAHATTAQMQSIVVVECTQKTNSSFLFVMNMFNTQVDAQNTVELAQNLKDDEPLGDDMYFEQAFDGSILNVWYETDDSPYFVNVKLGAINSFQTRVVSTPTTAVETDVVGVHQSSFNPTTTTPGTLVVKTFSQNDFKSFADPTVTVKTFSIQGTSTAIVSNSGIIAATSVAQTTVYLQASASASAAERKAAGDTSGFDSNFLSQGKLDLVMQTSEEAKKTLAKYAPKKPTLTKELLAKSTVHKAGSMLEVAQHMMAAKNTGKASKASEVVGASDLPKLATLATEALLARDLSKPISSDDMYKLDKLVRILRDSQTNMKIVGVLTPFLEKLDQPESALVAGLRKRLFYVLTAMDSPMAMKMLAHYGLRAKAEETRLHAVIAASSFRTPDLRLLDEISSIVETDKNDRVRSSAMVVLGTLLRRSHDYPRVQQGAALLVRLLEYALYQKDIKMADTLLHAISNAGHDLIPPSMLPAAVFKDPELVQIIQHKLGLVVLKDDPLPFNRSFSYSAGVGGKVLGVNAGVSGFAGSNFNCNNSVFNYEVFAQANATAYLFGFDQSAFQASFTYGKINGAPLADDIVLSVWGKTVYTHSFPAVDCAPHTYPITSLSPGFTVQHTLWVSVIPIVFSASLSLDLSLAWSWDICDSSLSASASLIPSSTLVFSGSAQLDLLIIKGEITLAGSLNTQYIPTLELNGAQCYLDFNIVQQNSPMDISLYVDYNVRKCKYWIFDCHWGEDQKKTIWDWNAPSSQKTVFDKKWPIAASVAGTTTTKTA